MPHLSDAEIILLVLAAFYLFDCCYRLDEGTLAFLSADGRRFRLLRAAPYLASQRGGILLSGIYPWSQTFLATSLPVSLDRDGAYSYAASALSPRGRGLPECRYVRFDDRPVFSASDREVLAGGELFLKVRSPQQARSIAERLNAIAQAPAEGRPAAIAALLARHTDADAAAERLARFRAAATPLAMFGGVLLVGTFLIAPALLWTMYDHPAAWRILFAFLSLYLLGWGLAIAAFRKLHRAVAPAESSDRLKQTLMMLVSPAGTMRGLTAISVALLADFHPLAAGRALLGEDQFRALARLALRDLAEPLRPVYPTTEAAAIRAIDAHRGALQAALVALVQKAGIDVDELLAPPAPEGPDVRAWCPRCEQQYAVPSGCCNDCGGIELAPFAARAV